MKLLAATTLAASAMAESVVEFEAVTIEFDYFVVTYECDAVDIIDFDYAEVYACDSHNGPVDTCERVYQEWTLEGGSNQVQCCMASDRAALHEGCELVEDAGKFEDGSMPTICDDYGADTTCTGVSSTEVGSYALWYDAADWSYNLATSKLYEVMYEDTTPPVIGEDCDKDGWSENVEKCTYFDYPYITSFDSCDLDTTDGVSLTYGGSVGYGTVSNSGAATSPMSEQFCTGGTTVDEVDPDTTGTYCLEYTAFDDSGNEALHEFYVVVVEDTTDCEIDFATTYNMHECCEDSDIIDYGEYSSNLPCSDEPAIETSYSFDGCHVTTEQQTVTYYAEDGEGNDCSGCTYFEIEDTTPPECTAPADMEHCVAQDGGDYECWSMNADGEGEWGECVFTGSDSCDDGFSMSDDHEDTVDIYSIGTYTVTNTIVDNSGNSNTCSNTHAYDDCQECECEPNTCTVVVEACTGTYEEMGATFFDTYDQDIQSKSTTSVNGVLGAELDVWEVGTHIVSYWAQDQSGHTCECSIDVVVQDTTPPVMAILSDEDTVIFEASDRNSAVDVGVGATCTDTCTALTATATGSALYGDHGSAHGPDASDMNQWITFSVVAYNYEDALYINNEHVSWYDEQQYYCWHDSDVGIAASQGLAAEAEAGQEIQGVKGAELELYLDMLADDCALYQVTYQCTDMVGLTATTVQYIATIDTTPPGIYSGSSPYSYLYSFGSPTATAAGCFAMIAGVALFAGLVANKVSRNGYAPIPV